MESGKPLLDGLNVVVNSAGGFSSVNETFGHSFVADLKVQDFGTRGDLFFEFFALKKIKIIFKKCGFYVNF